MEIKNRFEAREQEIYDELRNLAKPHVEASGGLFQLLDADPERYKAQSLTTSRIKGAPQDVGTVELIATAVEK